jgi:riboflavin kinase
MTEKKVLEVRGVVEEGIGEGREYVDIYRHKFQKALEIDPFPGTLNIRISEKSVWKTLLGTKGVMVPGFKKDNKYFGAVKCFKAKLSNAKCSECWVILPALSQHGSTLEVISPYYLRDELDIKNGSSVALAIKI